MQYRRFLVVVVAVAVAFSLVAPVLAEPGESGIIHVVQAGETLYSISRRYGVDVQAIAQANGIVNPNLIYVGQRLVIPTAQPSTGTIHVVQAGETLYRISLHYGVSMWDIASANGIVNMNHIYVGQHLVIPGSAPAPQPTQAPVTYPGPWAGEYFDNVSLTGEPYVTREDASINFDWAWGPPAGGMPENYFSVRWTGTFAFAEGEYRFYAKVDDGVRIYVDDALVVNGWSDGSYRLYSADHAMTAGDHAVRVEFYDLIQVARIRAWWSQVGGATATPGPTSTPGPTPTDGPSPTPGEDAGGSGDWYAEFFDNPNLDGVPTLTRYDPWIGFDWGVSYPGPGIHQDRFSARWTGSVTLNTDTYRFCAMSDDGARIWVGDTLVLDEWHPNNGVAHCGDFWTAGGTYPVKVQYYEDGGTALIYMWWEPH